MSHWRDFLDPTAAPGRYLAWQEVKVRTSLSRTTAWRLQRRDQFPRPYPISPGRVAHLESEVQAWIAWRAGGTATTPLQISERALDPSLPTCPPLVDHPVATAKPGATRDAPTLGLASGGPAARARPPARREKPGRRRTEHAKAIAQQIRFDF